MDRVRDEIHRLAAWGPVPPEAAYDDAEEDLEASIQAVGRVQSPIATAERRLLLTLLDRPHEDSLYGVLHLVVILVESAPATGWQLDLPTTDRPWFDYLRSRWMNYLHQRGEEQ